MFDKDKTPAATATSAPKAQKATENMQRSYANVTRSPVSAFKAITRDQQPMQEQSIAQQEQIAIVQSSPPLKAQSSSSSISSNTEGYSNASSTSHQRRLSASSTSTPRLSSASSTSTPRLSSASSTRGSTTHSTSLQAVSKGSASKLPSMIDTLAGRLPAALPKDTTLTAHEAHQIYYPRLRRNSTEYAKVIQLLNLITRAHAELRTPLKI